jgi:hypothetical protein
MRVHSSRLKGEDKAVEKLFVRVRCKIFTPTVDYGSRIPISQPKSQLL